MLCGEANELVFHVKDMYGLLVDGTVCAHYLFVEPIGVVGRFKSHELSSTAGLAMDHGERVRRFE